MSVRAPQPDGGTEIAPGVRVPASAIRIDYVASPGPGGQNVNRRATKAQLRIALADIPISPAARRRLEKDAGSKLSSEGVLMISCDESRSQKRNRDACLERLREMIVRAKQPPKARRPTRMPRGAVERRLDAKKRRSEIKRQRRRPEPPDR